eukprot:6299329-Prymnesium_polylepis.1
MMTPKLSASQVAQLQSAIESLDAEGAPSAGEAEAAAAAEAEAAGGTAEEDAMLVQVMAR